MQSGQFLRGAKTDPGAAVVALDACKEDDATFPIVRRDEQLVNEAECFFFSQPFQIEAIVVRAGRRLLAAPFLSAVVCSVRQRFGDRFTRVVKSRPGWRRLRPRQALVDVPHTVPLGIDARTGRPREACTSEGVLKDGFR